LLASNLVVECTQPPGGLWFRVNVTPGKDYIVELAGECQIGGPTLRIDLEDNDPENLQYLQIGNSGIKARVRSGSKAPSTDRPGYGFSLCGQFFCV